MKGGTGIRLSVSLKMILQKFFGMSVFKWIDIRTSEARYCGYGKEYQKMFDN